MSRWRPASLKALWGLVWAPQKCSSHLPRMREIHWENQPTEKSRLRLKLQLYNKISNNSVCETLLKRCLWETERDVRGVCAQSCPTLWRPHGLSPSRILRPWNFPGKNTGVGCRFFLQGIFPTQRWTCTYCVSCGARQVLHQLSECLV